MGNKTTATVTGAGVASDANIASVAACSKAATSITVYLGPMTNQELAAMSDESLCADLVETARAHSAIMGRETQMCSEIARRQAFRAAGATSVEAWLSANCHHSRANARSLAHVGERLFDLPRLQEVLSTGQASFDQVRALVDAADPETDGRWAAEAARGLSVGELTEMARRRRPERAPRCSEWKRPSVCLNDERRTMTARLPSETYAEVRGHLERAARDLGADGVTPYDERLGDALVALLRGGVQQSSRVASPPTTVVAHVRLDALFDESSELLAELERLGLVSTEVARRLACDAAFIVALNDEAGHTMYEGRARRFPTETQRRELWRRDRHCRFPGCPHEKFVQAHHIKPWKPGGGTDLDNLALLCQAHHSLVHSNGWSMWGDANVEIRFLSPDGRVTASHPSPLWETIGGSEATEGRSEWSSPSGSGPAENEDATTRATAGRRSSVRAGPDG
jgi:Domain of unknown function (DUF222)/HNH endonuclease